MLMDDASAVSRSLFLFLLPQPALMYVSGFKKRASTIISFMLKQEPYSNTVKKYLNKLDCLTRISVKLKLPLSDFGVLTF